MYRHHNEIVYFLGVFPLLFQESCFRKGDKQLIKNYRPISLRPICGKVFEKIIFNKLYNYLHTNNLITKNQSGFRPSDSTTNQLLYLIDEIHQTFDSTESYEVIDGFLDISNGTID